MQVAQVAKGAQAIRIVAHACLLWCFIGNEQKKPEKSQSRQSSLTVLNAANDAAHKAHAMPCVLGVGACCMPTRIRLNDDTTAAAHAIISGAIDCFYFQCCFYVYMRCALRCGMERYWREQAAARAARRASKTPP